MHRDPQSLGIAQIESVEGRVGQHDISDSAVFFKSDRRHYDTSSFVPTSGQMLIDGVGYDRQQQMRWPVGVPIDLVGNGLAAAHVVGNVLDVGHRSGAGRDVQGCDVEADPVPRLELVRGGEDLYPILDYFFRLYRSDCIPRELVERLPGLRTLVVEHSIGRL